MFYILGMDQHGVNHSQSNSDPSRPDVCGTAASRVSLYQSVDLSRE